MAWCLLGITAEQAETLLAQEMRDLLKVDAKERTLLGSITPFLVVVNLVLQILSGIGFDVPDILGTDLDSELLDIEGTTPDSPVPPSPPGP